jgi:hypothetical protein
MRKLIVFVALALAIPAAAIADNTAPPTVQAAAKAACRTERTAIGDAAFKLLHGANGFGKCVSSAVKSAKANDAAALNTCKKDQSDPAFAAAHGGKTFAQFYGKNSSGANALGKCVSATSSAADHALLAATIAAAKSCKTERADRAAFATKYGASANAFGKCVSSKVKTTPTP